jgi:urease accessory protein
MTITIIITTIMREVGMSELPRPALARLLWLSSPALPIGAYAYSRGLEQAATRGLVSDEASLASWIDGVLSYQVASLDAPVMLRVQRAAAQGDASSVAHWNEFLCANRESAEFALEDAQLGGSLLRLLEAQGVQAERLLEACRDHKPAHAAVFGVACAHFRIAPEASVLGYLMAFAENQVTAALKCLQLGQTAGQRVLGTLIAKLDALVGAVLARPDAELGAFAPGLALASALHESQYTRLFRS